MAKQVAENPKKKKVESKAPPKSTDKKLPVDNSNWNEVFRDFLDKFEDKGLDTPKYLFRAREMLNKNYNTLHVSLKDMKKFNLNLADFVDKMEIKLYSDISLLLKRFILEHQLGDSNKDIFFCLIRS